MSEFEETFDSLLRSLVLELVSIQFDRLNDVWKHIIIWSLEFPESLWFLFFKFGLVLWWWRSWFDEKWKIMSFVSSSALEWICYFQFTADWRSSWDLKIWMMTWIIQKPQQSSKVWANNLKVVEPFTSLLIKEPTIEPTIL